MSFDIPSPFNLQLEDHRKQKPSLNHFRCFSHRKLINFHYWLKFRFKKLTLFIFDVGLVYMKKASFFLSCFSIFALFFFFQLVAAFSCLVFLDIISLIFSIWNKKYFLKSNLIMKKSSVAVLSNVWMKVTTESSFR